MLDLSFSTLLVGNDMLFRQYSDRDIVWEDKCASQRLSEDRARNQY